LDREVISLFLVFIEMLRPIVGVAVGSAGTLKAVCHIMEQDELVTLGYQRKHKQNDGARGTNGESKNAYRVWWGSVKDKDKGHLEDSVEWRIILKWILNNCDRRA
jgi:hypothetical protein